MLGATFGVGWVPCIGPALATILATAAASRRLRCSWRCSRSALGLSLVAVALGFQHARAWPDWLRRHGRAIEAVRGVLLIAVGTLFACGQWRRFFIPMQRRFAEPGWPRI